MPKFSPRSRERLFTCHPDLIRLMEAVIEHVDITILCGHRTAEEQAELHSKGMTKLDGSSGKMSKHNYMPSKAVDFSPWPVDWQDRERWIAAAYYVKATADQLGIKVRLGADWNGDMRFSESFFDAPHVELVS
jgi:peptidoglycan LD-endopeptidase CwlK